MGIVWPFIPARLWPHGKGSPGAQCSQRGCVLATLFPYRIKPWVKIHNGYTKHLSNGCLSCTFNFNHGSVSVFSCFSALEVYTGLKESNSSICLSVWQPAGIYYSGRVEGQSKQRIPFGLSNPGFKTGSITHFQFMKNISGPCISVFYLDDANVCRRWSWGGE